MPGLSAKVFRTYNASHTFQQQLDKMDLTGESIPDKLLAFNRANREVAVLCNHQKAASKNHSQQMEKITDKVNKSEGNLFYYISLYPKKKTL
jgi:DNA topoisomerase-1